jgi:hypothetical protein
MPVAFEEFDVATPSFTCPSLFEVSSESKTKTFCSTHFGFCAAYGKSGSLGFRDVDTRT